MAFEIQGSSSVFCKDVKNMLPFDVHSKWNFAPTDSIITHSANPMVTGSSVIGLKFKDGVMICADTLGSFGKMARYFNCERVIKVNDQVILGASGDIADFQHLKSVLEQSVISDECLNDGFSLKPKELYCWLTRMLYNRRSQFDPLWNIYVVGGLQDGVPFLGYVNKLGTSFEDKCVASGFGMHLSLPYLREILDSKPEITMEEAREMLENCMKTLYVRDTVAFPRYTLGIVTKEGVKIEGPFHITDVDWSLSILTDGYENAIVHS